jgi:DNA-binding transcriptional MerR regulator
MSAIATEQDASTRDTRGMYRSGVAARLAGVPVNTLRVWERRYAVVGPGLSTGRQRLYSPADVRRLTLIKQLVDMGHPIGTVASLGDEVLAGMRTTGMSMPANPTARPSSNEKERYRVALVGPLLMTEQLQQSLGEHSLEVAGSCPSPNRAAAALQGLGVDLVIIELPTLSEPEIELVASIKSACGASVAAVLYRYAPTAIIRKLRMAGHAVARATSDALEIEAICLSLLRAPALSGNRTSNALLPLGSSLAPEPRFNERDLAYLSGVSSKLACECPRHVVDLVMNLRSFERYSAQCANRNTEDATLHLALQNAAGLARGIMEQALDKLVAAEGLRLPGEEARS